MMSSQIPEPVEDNIYLNIVSFKDDFDSDIISHNTQNRINKIPKIIQNNKDLANNIEQVLNKRQKLKDANLKDTLLTLSTKLTHQSTSFMERKISDLNAENNNLQRELNSLNMRLQSRGNNYSSKELRPLRDIKIALNYIYDSKLENEKSKNTTPEVNIHDLMAEIIPSMILEIGVNQINSHPIKDTIKVSHDPNALNFSKQYLYSLHQDSILYERAIQTLKKHTSTLSSKKTHRKSNYYDIVESRKTASAFLEKIIKDDFSLSSADAEEKLADLLLEGDDFYSRLYVIFSAIIYHSICHGWNLPYLKKVDPQLIIDAYLQYSYLEDKINNQRIEPVNYTSFSELKSNLHFDSQREYNKQFSDYKGSSSQFDAETITRHLINLPTIHNAKGIRELESLYFPPAQAFHYTFKSASGGLTAIQFLDDNWLVISSYNGNFAAKIFPDTGNGSYDAMFAVLKKPLEIPGNFLTIDGIIIPNSQYILPERLYPNVDANDKSKQDIKSEQDAIDAFLSKLHNVNIKGAAVKIDVHKDITKPDKTSSYEIIIQNLQKDLHSHADAFKNAFDYSGLVHTVATYIVPFYDVIYKSVTDEKYELDGSDIISIVFDALDIAITVISAGISVSTSISKAITESTIRLSKSGLTRQALKHAVLKEIVTKKIINKNALKNIAHFADDIINPVPYKTFHHLLNPPTAFKSGKHLQDAGLADFISRGGGDFSLGLKRHVLDSMAWKKYKVPKPDNLIRMDRGGKFEGIYSLRSEAEAYFIKNKSNYHSVKYDEALDSWRVQSPSNPKSYQHSFPVKKKGNQWIRLKQGELSPTHQKHHIDSKAVFTDEVTERIRKNSINKATVKKDLHQMSGADKDFLFYNDEMNLYIKKSGNEYYDFEYLAPDQDIAFIGKSGKKRLAVIYNRDKRKFDVINSYWDNGEEVFMTGSNGDISKTLSYDKNTKLYTLKTDTQSVFLEYDEVQNSLTKSHITGVTKLEGNVWRKEYDDFFIYEGSSQNSRLVIDGHGGEIDTWLASEFDIPESSQFNFYAPHGKSLQAPVDSLEDFVKNKFEYAQNLPGGQKSPDYTLSFFEDPVSFREIAHRNKANILQVKQGHDVRLSDVIKKISDTKGKSYTQFDIAVCRPRSGLSGIIPSGIYEAKAKTK